MGLRGAKGWRAWRARLGTRLLAVPLRSGGFGVGADFQPSHHEAQQSLRQTVNWSDLPCEARFWEGKLGPAKVHYL